MSLRHHRLLEQVQQYGIEQLSDADLLALVLSKGTATDHQRALKRIQALLTERGGLAGMLTTDVGELLEHEFDAVLATRLHALLEVARRLTRPVEKHNQIISVEDVAQLVGPEMRYLDHEEMRVLVLDTKNYVVANVSLYRGTVNSSVLRVAELFRPAITRKCPNLIICHNHPSGDPSPSPEDMDVTRMCVQAGELLNIEVLDHIIIGNPKYVSLKQKMRW